MEYKKTPAQLFVLRAYCDCGQELKYTGMYYKSEPVMYEHKCPKCNIRYNFSKCFPTTEVEEIDTHKEVLD